LYRGFDRLLENLYRLLIPLIARSGCPSDRTLAVGRGRKGPGFAKAD
jgi:hypothetical protein